MIKKIFFVVGGVIIAYLVYRFVLTEKPPHAVVITPLHDATGEANQVPPRYARRDCDTSGNSSVPPAPR